LPASDGPGHPAAPSKPQPRNRGASAITSWTTTWTLASGQTITQLWSGTLTTSGSAATVRNVSWNGALSPGSSTTYGFIANGTPSSPTITCTSP
jgi:cellulase/cellobiase CelA1